MQKQLSRRGALRASPTSPIRSSDRGIESLERRTLFSIGTSFLSTTLPEAGLVPPDGSGDVGPSQILVATNGRIKVFDKTGSLGGLNEATDVFFASVRNGTSTSNPRVRYDRLSGRWFVTMINSDAPANRILI